MLRVRLKLDRGYLKISAYALGVIVAALVAFMLLGQVGWLVALTGRVARALMPLIFGIVFAFLLNPMYKVFERRLLPAVFAKRKTKPGALRGLAMLLTYLTTFLLIGAGMAIVIPQLAYSVSGLWEQMPIYRRAFNYWYLNVSRSIQQFSAGGGEADIFSYILANAVDSSWAITGNLMDRGFEFFNHAFDSLLIAATNFTTSLVNIVLGLVISVYILKDKKRICAQLNKGAVAIFPKRVYLLLYDIAGDIHRIFSGFVIGRIIDSLVIGALCAVGMAILGIPHIALVTVIIGVTNFVPIFGPIFGAIPSIFIIFTADPVKALWFAVFILVIQQLESNILGPKILGDIIGLPPLMVILSLILGVSLMGFVGMLIGVPLFAVIYSIARRFICYLLERKGYPTWTMEYSPERNPLLKEKGAERELSHK